MNYYQRIQRSINFIESHLTQKISLKEVAEQAYCSLYYFHRMFYAMTGKTVKEYIRKRRLTEAAYKLSCSQHKIIDIALDYQYKSHESFSRAFKNTYGITPTEYQKYKPYLTFTEKINVSEKFDQNNKINSGDILMQEPNISYKEAFNVIGVTLRTTEKNNRNIVEIPKFWDAFRKNNVFKTFPDPEANELLGLCYDNNEEGDFSYMICQETTQTEHLAENMTIRTIPSSYYAIFTVKGAIPAHIQQTLQYIYSQWLPHTHYERADSEEFELYKNLWTLKGSTEFCIYIPIQK